jgi:hypothetical protein
MRVGGSRPTPLNFDIGAETQLKLSSLVAGLKLAHLVVQRHLCAHREWMEIRLCAGIASHARRMSGAMHEIQKLGYSALFFQAIDFAGA